MEGILFLLVLGIVGAIILVIWLTVKTVAYSSAGAELRRRQERLEGELSRLEARLKAVEARPAEEAPASTEQFQSTVETLLQRQRTFEPVRPPPIPAAPPAPVPTPIRKSEPPVFAAATAAPPPAAVPSHAPAPTPVPPSPPRYEAPRPALPAINWEQFMGVKLLAWAGGLAFFLCVAYFVKYSFDNNLISPEVRMAMGFLAGLGLIVGGFVLKRKEYLVTSQTLCATGVVILYACTFACHAVYKFPLFAVIPSFLLMALITAVAFLLAVRMDGQVVAVLGILGGFLTPVLLSTGHDNPLGLFGYVALLDIGLMVVALHRRWNYLVLLGGLGTAAMQIAWAAAFFEAAKIFIAMAVFLGFDVLFLLAFATASRRGQSNPWMAAATLLVSFLSLAFVFYLLTVPGLSERPTVIFSFITGADLCLLALVLLEARLHATHLAAGAMVFLLLSTWTLGYLSVNLLNWALAMFLLFAALHSVFPLVLQRFRPGVAPVWWGHLFPPLALVLVMMPMFKFTELTWFLWPCVLLVDVLAVGLAALTASVAAIVAVLLLTVGVTAVWLLHVPAVVGDVGEMLVVIGGFAVFFFMVGVFAGRKVFGNISEALGARPKSDPLLDLLGVQSSPEVMRAQLPAMSAILPFVLLIMVVSRLPLANPSPVFGLALLMVTLLLGVTRAFKLDALAGVGLACTLALELSWHEQHFRPDTAAGPLVWYLVFFAVFAVFPFLFQKAFEGRTLAWAVAALSGPAHFFLVHPLIERAYPNDYMGLVPAAFAVPALISLAALVRQIPTGNPKRLTLLAWFGGVALFFITLIFPIQFRRQWLTIGWALEGAALVWLFHRVPHPGLRMTGLGLLVAAFVRLALNPAVLAYHPRTETPVFNWYLYAYGVVTICLFAGAWLLRRPRNMIGDFNTLPLLITLGAVLAFLLVNIEIADYFTSPGAPTLTFEFSGNFGRDMTYTMAWSLYALILLVAGIWQRTRPVRYAGLGLLGVALLKLFLHDLAQLEALYRISALLVVAVIASAASFLYQRFFAAVTRTTEPARESGVLE